MKPITLRPSYASREDGTINAYTNEAARLKYLFLQDARRYLRAVGNTLADLGVSGHEYVTNKAGIAVSGEVWAYFWVEGQPEGLFVEVGTTLLRAANLSFPVRSSDGVCILVQRRTWQGDGSRRRLGRIVGGNYYFHPDLDSRSLAWELLPLLGIEVQSDEKPAIVRQASFAF